MSSCQAFIVSVMAIVGLLAPAGARPLSACSGTNVPVAEQCLSTDAITARIDTIVKDVMTKRGLKAVLAGVSWDGRPVVIKAWGESMAGVPATSDMHFRNGAIAIGYISTVLLQLRDEKNLRLDDKLAKWFPHYPMADKITLAMLINQTSGYADYVSERELVPPFYANPFRQWQPDELIAMGLKQPMVCAPGTCWSYAHTNFVLLGKVLEKATGKSLAQLIHDRILGPLSLRNTRSEDTPLIQEPVLHAFDAERGRYEESTYWNPSWTLARGAIMTTNIADVLKTAEMLGTGSLLSPQAHKIQLAPQTVGLKPWTNTTYYSLGIAVTNGWLALTPSFAGYAASLNYLPSRKLAIAVSVTAQERASLDDNLAKEIAHDIAAYMAPEAPF